MVLGFLVNTVQVKKNGHIFCFMEKNLKFQGETANFSEKFQGEITEFLRENMELYRQNLQISARNTGISWRKYWISWRNLEKFSTISPRKEGRWRKIKRGNFSSPALYFLLGKKVFGVL